MKLSTFKKIVKFIVGISTAWTVGNVIGNNTNAEKPHQKVEVAVAGAVIGAMVADQAEEYTDRAIDEIANIFKSDEKVTRLPL